MTDLMSAAFAQCASLVGAAYQKAVAAGQLPDGAAEGACDVPKDAAHGDVANSFALTAAKACKMPPRAIAETIMGHIDLAGSYFDKVEVAGAGFLNFFYSCAWRAALLAAVEAGGGDYGKSDWGRGKRVMVEFVSANPTGPMTLGNARGGVLGDVLASALEATGHEVWREFYVNDAGNQVLMLAESLYARYVQRLRGETAAAVPEKGYHGDDIRDLADEFIAAYGDSYLAKPKDECLPDMQAFAVTRNVDTIKADLLRYRIHYDEFFSERNLRDSGAVDETVELLRQNGHLYEADGATWFRATAFGGEKDEVIVTSKGNYTYYAADIAYHRNKLIERGFDVAIDVLGADHHGHTLRFRAGLEAVGIDPQRLQFALYQLVSLTRDGETVRMSKRTGKSITLADLLDDVSVDAARFFFNNRSTDTHLEFDMGLAVREDADNPVYYVQYAHARIHSVLAKLAAEGVVVKPAAQLDAGLLTHETELSLLKTLAAFPGEVSGAAAAYQPYRINRCLLELAAAFHKFYNACRIKEAEPAVRDARLKLADSVRQVLKNGLTLLNVTAPEAM